MNGEQIVTLLVLAGVGIVFVLMVLALLKGFVWWLLGVDERLKEAKRTNELLEQLIAPPPSPPVEIPTAETQPRRNPLTQR